MGSNETIKVTPDEIDAVARKVVGPAYDKVQAALKTFEGTHEGAGAFGGSGPGQHLGELHASVKSVFVKTVTGVGDDLDTFKHNLHKTAAGWRDTDESNAERAQSLASRLGGTSAAATQAAYTHGRRAEGEKLQVDPSLAHHGKNGNQDDHPSTGPDGHEHGHGHDQAPAPQAAPTGEGSGAGGG